MPKYLSSLREGEKKNEYEELNYKRREMVECDLMYGVMEMTEHQQGVFLEDVRRCQ